MRERAVTDAGAEEYVLVQLKKVKRLSRCSGAYSVLLELYTTGHLYCLDCSFDHTHYSSLPDSKVKPSSMTILAILICSQPRIHFQSMFQ